MFKIGSQDINKLYIGNQEINKVYLGNQLIYTNEGGGGDDPTDEYKTQYLTIESLEDGNVIQWKMVQYKSTYVKNIQYSTDGSTWNTAGSSSAGTTLATLNTGDKLYIKGTNTSYTEVVSSTFGATFYTSQFVISKKYNLYGNIMSMISGDNFVNSTTLTKIHTFRNMFNSTPVVDARNLVLPAQNLVTSCYGSMFSNCSQLTTAPYKIAAASYTGGTSICGSMFQNCTSLTTPPKLPATALGQSCYSMMFYGCTSLTKPAELPNNLTLAAQCFMQMYNGCTGLTDVYEYLLPYNILASQCYLGMFMNCTGIEKIYLPAFTLEAQCYQQMFYGCTNLKQIDCLASDISATNCTNLWVQDVSSTGTFVKYSASVTWTTGTSGIPTGWTVINAH